MNGHPINTKLMVILLILLMVILFMEIFGFFFKKKTWIDATSLHNTCFYSVALSSSLSYGGQPLLCLRFGRVGASQR